MERGYRKIKYFQTFERLTAAQKRRRFSFLKQNQMNEFNHSYLATSDFDSADSIENSFFDSDAALQYDEAALQQSDNFLGIRGKKGRAKVQARKLEKAQFKNDLEQVRSGMTIGEVRAQQAQALQNLNNTAAATGLAPETVALANVAANAPTVASYVQQQGLVPQQNPAALAMQATQSFLQEVDDRQSEGVPDWDTAHDSVIQDYQDAGWDEADNFFGSILQSVFAAGKALVEKINAKRTAKGKKPLFGGKGWKKIAEKVADNKEVVTDAMSAAEKAFLALTKKEVTEAVRKEKQSAIGAGADALINDQKKQAIKEYLPYILIGVVLIYVVAKHT